MPKQILFRLKILMSGVSMVRNTLMHNKLTEVMLIKDNQVYQCANKDKSICYYQTKTTLTPIVTSQLI